MPPSVYIFTPFVLVIFPWIGLPLLAFLVVRWLLQDDRGAAPFLRAQYRARVRQMAAERAVAETKRAQVEAAAHAELQDAYRRGDVEAAHRAFRTLMDRSSREDVLDAVQLAQRARVLHATAPAR